MCNADLTVWSYLTQINSNIKYINSIFFCQLNMRVRDLEGGPSSRVSDKGLLTKQTDTRE